jgi:hypothetical protein
MLVASRTEPGVGEMRVAGVFADVAHDDVAGKLNFEMKALVGDWAVP